MKKLIDIPIGSKKKSHGLTKLIMKGSQRTSKSWTGEGLLRITLWKLFGQWIDEKYSRKTHIIKTDLAYSGSSCM